MPFITSISLILDTILNIVQLDWNTLYPMKECPMEEWDAEDLKEEFNEEEVRKVIYGWRQSSKF